MLDWGETEKSFSPNEACVLRGKITYRSLTFEKLILSKKIIIITFVLPSSPLLTAAAFLGNEAFSQRI